jgi:DNA-binding CsgD family transcriptional regulator
MSDPGSRLGGISRLSSALRAAEQRGLRGEPDAALRGIADLPLGGADQAVLRSVAECATLLALWGGAAPAARQLCDAALAATDDASTRGRILLCLARITPGEPRHEAYTAALTEFSTAGDTAGQALALAGLAYPRATDSGGIVASYHLRLARDALRLAMASGDPHALAVCTANLAAGETYLGRPATIRRWQRAAEQLPADLGTYPAEAMSLNYANWALTAAGHGEYAQARRALTEGRALARGVAWARTFSAIEALVAWRTGSIDAALAAADRTLAGRGSAASERCAAMASVITIAVAFERERRPDVTALSTAVHELGYESDQLGSAALAIQARIRAGRREPDPCRGLVPALEAAARRRRRFGWEDVAITLAEVDPPTAATVLPAMGGMWPRGRRGLAAKRYVDGLLAGPAGYAALIEASEAFLALPEPLAAASALRAAAEVAPMITTGNRLRAQALDLYVEAGADRSATAVLRERKLRRTVGTLRVPASQRNLVHAGLTPREHEVASLVRSGLTAVEISQKLSLSVGTVRNHIARIRDKFGGVSKRRLADILGREP